MFIDIMMMMVVDICAVLMCRMMTPIGDLCSHQEPTDFPR